MATQLDIIQKQAEAAARNTAARAQGSLRRNASLVNQASRLAGRAMVKGEDSLRRQAGKRPQRDPFEKAVPPKSRETCPASDGYVRRSPVQPLYIAEDYRKKQIKRLIGVAAVILIVCAGIYLLGRLGILTR